MHATLADTALYCPAAHALQLADPELDANDPSEQLVQVQEPVAPVVVEYKPAPHPVHAAALCMDP